MTLPATVGRYVPIRLLGRTSLGAALFLAKDTRLGREVAVEVVPDDVDAGEEREPLEEHLREGGERAAALSHPNLTTLLDAGEDEVLGPYLVFEHAGASTVRERLAQGPLSSLQVSRLAREIGGALTHVHDTGLVHGAVTPENVHVAPNGAKLGDFDRLGPPGPDADAYADAFALAATLYEALAGHPRSMVHDPTVDPRAQVVFARALHRDKAERFPSCRAFGEALAAALTDSSPLVSLPPESTPVRLSTVPRATRKKQNVLAGSALAVILLLFFYGRHADPAPDTASRKPAIEPHVQPAPHPREKRKEPELTQPEGGAIDAADGRSG